MFARAMLVVLLGCLAALFGADASTVSSTLIRQETTRGQGPRQKARDGAAVVDGHKQETSGRQSDANIIIVEGGDTNEADDSPGIVTGNDNGADDSGDAERKEAASPGSLTAATAAKVKSTEGHEASLSATGTTLSDKEASAESVDDHVAAVDGQKAQVAGSQSDSDIIIVDENNGASEADGSGSQDENTGASEADDIGTEDRTDSLVAYTEHQDQSSGGHAASGSAAASAEQREKAVADVDGRKGEKSERQSEKDIIIVEEGHGSGGEAGDDAVDGGGSVGEEAEERGDAAASGSVMASAAHEDKSNQGHAASRWASASTEHSEKATLPAKAMAGGSPALLDGKSTGSGKDVAADISHRMGTASVDKETSAESAHDDVAVVGGQEGKTSGNQSDSNIYIIEPDGTGSSNIRTVDDGQGDATETDDGDADTRSATSSTEHSEKVDLSAKAIAGSAPTLLEGKTTGSVQGSSRTTMGDKEASADSARDRIADVDKQKGQVAGSQSDSDIIIVDQDETDDNDDFTKASLIAHTTQRDKSQGGHSASRFASSSSERTEKVSTLAGHLKGEKSARQSDSNIIIVEGDGDGHSVEADDAGSAGDDAEDPGDAVATGSLIAESAHKVKSNGGHAASRSGEKAVVDGDGRKGEKPGRQSDRNIIIVEDGAGDGGEADDGGSVGDDAEERGDAAASASLIEHTAHKVKSNGGRAASRSATSSTEHSEKAELSAKAMAGAAPTLLEGKTTGSVQGSSKTTLGDEEASADSSRDSIADVDKQKGQLAGSQSDSDIIIVDQGNGESETDDDDDDFTKATAGASPTLLEAKSTGKVQGASAERAHDRLADVDDQKDQLAGSQSDSDIIIVDKGNGESEGDDEEDEDARARSLIADTAHKEQSNGQVASRSASSSTEHSDKATAKAATALLEAKSTVKANSKRRLRTAVAAKDASAEGVHDTIADVDDQRDQLAGRHSDSNIIIVEQGDGQGDQADAGEAGSEEQGDGQDDPADAGQAADDSGETLIEVAAVKSGKAFASRVKPHSV